MPRVPDEYQSRVTTQRAGYTRRPSRIKIKLSFVTKAKFQNRSRMLLHLREAEYCIRRAGRRKADLGRGVEQQWLKEGTWSILGTRSREVAQGRSQSLNGREEKIASDRQSEQEGPCLHQATGCSTQRHHALQLLVNTKGMKPSLSSPRDFHPTPI